MRNTFPRRKLACCRTRMTSWIEIHQIFAKIFTLKISFFVSWWGAQMTGSGSSKSRYEAFKVLQSEKRYAGASHMRYVHFPQKFTGNTCTTAGPSRAPMHVGHEEMIMAVAVLSDLLSTLREQTWMWFVHCILLFQRREKGSTSKHWRYMSRALRRFQKNVGFMVYRIVFYSSVQSA